MAKTAKVKVEKDKVTLPDGTNISSSDKSVNFIDEYNKAFLDVLTKGKSDSPYLFARIMEKDVVRALVEPNSHPAMFIRKNAQQILKKGMTVAESEDLKQKLTFKIWSKLSPKQRDMIFDMFKKKCMVAGRRSGKSLSLCAFFWILSLNSDDKHRYCAYIEKSISSAFRALWQGLNIVGEWIGEKPVSHGGEYITLGDNLTIYLGGYSNKNDPDRWRGHKLSCIFVDEVQGAKSVILEDMVKNVLVPTMATYFQTYDFYDTCFIFSGSPDYVGSSNYIRSFYKNAEWKKYAMTIMDNPSIKDPIGFAREYLEFNNIPFEFDDTKDGLDKFICNDVGFRREILGDLEAEDLETTIFRHQPEIIDYNTIKMFTPDVEIACGIDWGFVDKTSIVMLAIDWDQDTLTQSEKGKIYTRKKMWVLKVDSGIGWSASILKQKIRDFAAFGQDIYQKIKIQNKVIRFFVDHNNPSVVADVNKESQIIDLNHLGMDGQSLAGSYICINAIKNHKAQVLFNLADYIKQKNLLFAIDSQSDLIKDIKEAKWQKEDNIIISDLDDSQWSRGHGDSLMALSYVFYPLYSTIFGYQLNELQNIKEQLDIPLTDIDRFLYSKKH